MHQHTKIETNLWIALGLTALFVCVEVIGGWLSGSLALLSDAGHMFTDVVSLAIALTAIKLGKRVADKKRTFGYYRFEILAAVLNAVILLLIACYIFFEAYHRYQSPHPHYVNPPVMFIIACIGLIVNLIGMRLLHAGGQQSLNVRGAYLEAWADMLGSLGVMTASVIIYSTDWQGVDSLIAMLIGLWVLPRTWSLLKESINILLEGVPEGVELAAIYYALSEIPGVLDVHDLHVWALTSGRISLTVHFVIDPENKNIQAILESGSKILKEKFQISHTTIQLEVNHCGHDDLDTKT